jgi:hypothetical protein
MTGFPDLPGGNPQVPGPDEPLLRQPPGYLPPPAGAYGQIRRRATRRRRLRAAGGGVAAAAVLTGSLYLVGVLSPQDRGGTVSPPATGSLASPAPRTVQPGPPTTAPTPAPSVSATTGRGSGTPSAGTPTGSHTATASPTQDGGTGAAHGGTTPMCTASQLTAALGGGDAGAGNLYRYLLLTNHGTAACHLTGYPGVSLLDAHGKRIGQPADRQPMSYTPVVLRPGESASDTIHTANRMGTCWPASATVRIYPPGSRQWLDVPGDVTICSDLFTITPLVAGRTGNPPG